MTRLTQTRAGCKARPCSFSGWLDLSCTDSLVLANTNGHYSLAVSPLEELEYQGWMLAGFVELNEQFEMQARTWPSNESVMTFGAGCVCDNVAKRCTEGALMT